MLQRKSNKGKVRHRLLEAFLFQNLKKKKVVLPALANSCVFGAVMLPDLWGIPLFARVKLLRGFLQQLAPLELQYCHLVDVNKTNSLKIVQPKF